MNGTDWVLIGFAGGVLMLVLIIKWKIDSARNQQEDHR